MNRVLVVDDDAGMRAALEARFLASRLAGGNCRERRRSARKISPGTAPADRHRHPHARRRRSFASCGRRGLWRRTRR